MTVSSSIQWIQHGELISGQGDPTDVLNRPVRNILSASGYSSDGSDFAGFVPMASASAVTIQSGSFIIVSGSASGTIATTAYVTGSATGITGTVIAQNFIMTGSFSVVTGSTFHTTGSIGTITGSTFVTGTVTNIASGVMTGNVTNFTGSASGTITNASGQFNNGWVTFFTGSASNSTIQLVTGSISGSVTSATGSFNGTIINHTGSITGSVTSATGSFLGTVTNFFANAISGATGSFSGSATLMGIGTGSFTLASGSFTGSVTNFSGSIVNNSFTSSFSGSGLLVVSSSQDTSAQTAPTGSMVYNLTTRKIERKTTGGLIRVADYPTDTVVPQSFADKSWVTSTGTPAVGVGQFTLVTAQDIANNPQWRGQYFPNRDTRDYVCLQEAIYEAAAPNSMTGSIVWNGSGLKPVFIPGGQYYITRQLWIAETTSLKIFGAGKLVTLINMVQSDETALWTNGFSYSEMSYIGFQTSQIRNIQPIAHFHKPLVNLDWVNSSVIGTINNAPGDNVPRTVISSSMPLLARTGSNWTPNQYVSQSVVIVDDPINPSAIGQVRRIVENTVDTLYIAGRWDWLPSISASFIINPSAASWGRWQTQSGSNGSDSNVMTDWLTNFTSITPTVDGQTLRRFSYRGSVSFPGIPAHVESYQILSHTSRSLYIAQWSSSVPYPTMAAGDFSSRFLGSNGIAQDITAPMYRACNYVIGGQYFDYTGGHGIASDNSNWVMVSGTPWGTNDHCGAYVQVVSSSNGLSQTAITNESSGVVAINGLSRQPNGDIGKYLVATTGGNAGQWRFIVANTTSSFTLDSSIGLSPGDYVEIVDPGLGQLLPISANTSNRIDTYYDNNAGIMQYYMWSRRPKYGDQVKIIQRTSNQPLEANRFVHISVGANNSDCAWAWAFSGDSSMGSETTWQDCHVGGNWIGFFANGYNVIDLHWFGGGSSAYMHSFYIPRGGMNFQGIGLGGQTLGTQLGSDIFLSNATRSHTVINSAYTENMQMLQSGQPVVMNNCEQAGSTGFAYNTLNRTWQPGDFWVPTNHKGRLFLCVEVIGNGSGAGITEPTSVAEGYDPMVLLTLGVNGIRFIRLDWIGVGASGAATIVGGAFCFTQLSVNNSQSTVIGTAFSRPDWQGTNTNLNSFLVQASSTALGITINPALVDGNWNGQYSLPVNTFYGTDPTQYESQPHSHIVGGPLILAMGYNGNPVQTGLMPIAPQIIDPTSSVGVLAFLDGGSSITPGTPFILSKRPTSGSNVAGYDMRIAGGQGTGAGGGGKIRFMVAQSGSGYAAQNATGSHWFADAAEIDTNKRLKLYGRSIVNISIASNLNSTPDVSNCNYLVISNSGSTVITNLVVLTGSLEDGHELTLEFTNSNTTLQSNSNIKLNGGMDINSTPDGTVKLLYRGGVWRQIAPYINNV